MSLDLLGVGALKQQYIVINIRSIDAEKLKAKLAEPPTAQKPGLMASVLPALTGAGVWVLDSIPKAVMDIALPAVATALKEYGIDATLHAVDVPPGKGGKSISEFWPGMVVGGGAIGAGWAMWHYGMRRLLT